MNDVNQYQSTPMIYNQPTPMNTIQPTLLN